MENEKNYEKNGVYSKRVRAGKRRTYFFDVRTTRANDYYLTITESKKRFEDDNYDRHKIFIYKEDFVKFVNAMQETVDYVKSELLPDYDFDAHNHDEYEEREYKSEKSFDKPAIAAEPEVSKPSLAETEVEEKSADEKSIAESESEPEIEIIHPASSNLSPPDTEDVEKWD